MGGEKKIRQERDMGMSSGVKRRGAGGVKTVLVLGLSNPTVRALGRLLGKRFYIERASDAADCLKRVSTGGGVSDATGSLSAVIVDPGLSEFDGLTFAMLLRRYRPHLPLFFFGSAQDACFATELPDPDITRCFKSPAEIYKLALAVAPALGERAVLANRIVETTLEFIATDYSQIDRIGAISRSIGVSREHLSRQFTRYTGHTLSDFVTIYRVERAKELLFDGLLIKQVYSEVGFKCESSFFRAFLKHAGITPKGYRDTMLVRRRGADAQQLVRASLQGIRSQKS